MNYIGEIGELWSTTFQHVYLLGSFMPGAEGRHNCLRSGYWCWQNLREHPLDVIGYIRHKLK